MKKVRAFTDGSAYWKIGKGGYGAYIEFPDSQVELSGGFIQTKTGRMEMMALLRTIEAMPNEPLLLTVFSDSEYVVKTFDNEMARLQKWINKDFIGVKNADLWNKIIDAFLDKPDMRFQIYHIRGHQKIENDLQEGNAIADALADYKSHDSYDKDMSDEEWSKNKSNK